MYGCDFTIVSKVLGVVPCAAGMYPPSKHETQQAAVMAAAVDTGEVGVCVDVDVSAADAAAAAEDDTLSSLSATEGNLTAESFPLVRFIRVTPLLTDVLSGRRFPQRRPCQ